MKRDDLDRLRAELWRRPLNAEEAAQLEAWLRPHPEAREDWALEQALTRALQSLPEREPPPSLHARVWAELDRDTAAAGPVRWREILGALRTAWVRWAIAGGVALLLGILSWQPFTPPNPPAPEVVRVWNDWAAPPEVWADFDVVARLPAGPGPDLELLTLLE